MNNRYTFRGRRYDNGEWIEGWITSQFKKTHDGEVLTRIKSTVFGGGEHLVNTETVGQCTGLKDKNGKLIFEGDVVKADGYIFIVKFGKCGGVANNENYGYMGYYLDGFDSMTKDVLRFGLRNDICYFTDIDVIGNIHDNPESLEVER